MACWTGRLARPLGGLGWACCTACLFQSAVRTASSPSARWDTARVHTSWDCPRIFLHPGTNPALSLPRGICCSEKNELYSREQDDDDFDGAQKPHLPHIDCAGCCS